MLLYAARRLLFAMLLIWAVASAAFVLTRLAPGDATFPEGWERSMEEREAEQRRLGLDQPLIEHYARWLSGAAQLDLGQSSLYSRPVAALLRERLANTVVLAAAALALAAVFGIGLGLYTGARPATATARIVGVFAVLFLSTPPLIGSLVLVLVAARTGWMPVGGMSSDAALTGWARWADLLAHLPVPALALALPLAATLERVQAQALSETMGQPFVGATRARGVGAGEALLRHAWPVSLGPVLGIYGLMIGALLSGSFVVEVVTAWPGLGRLMVDALRARDLFLVAGTAAAGATCLAFGTILGDLVHAALDPRVREIS